MCKHLIGPRIKFFFNVEIEKEISIGRRVCNKFQLQRETEVTNETVYDLIGMYIKTYKIRLGDQIFRKGLGHRVTKLNLLNFTKSCKIILIGLIGT